MNYDHVEDHELLYRAVPKFPNYWNKDRNSVSSALFKDKNGVSVDRDGNRKENVICKQLQNKISNSIAAISVKTNSVRSISALVLPKPSNANQYHAEIHDSETKILLSSSKAKRLSKMGKLIWFTVK